MEMVQRRKVGWIGVRGEGWDELGLERKFVPVKSKLEELRGHKFLPVKSKLKQLLGHKVVPVKSKLKVLQEHKAIPVKSKLEKKLC